MLTGCTVQGSNPGKGETVFSVQRVQPGSGAHPPCYSMGTAFFPGEQIGLGVKLTIPPPRSPYIFMAWTGTSLPLLSPLEVFCLMYLFSYIPYSTLSLLEAIRDKEDNAR
jgi:hypothetical protein